MTLFFTQFFCELLLIFCEKKRNKFCTLLGIILSNLCKTGSFTQKGYFHVHYSTIRSFRFIKLYKKSDHVFPGPNIDKFTLRTKSKVYFQKEIHKKKLTWFVGYLALCAYRNMFKKYISASPTVSFSARKFKTYVNYLKAMINRFTILISIYLGFLIERQR